MQEFTVSLPGNSRGKLFLIQLRQHTEPLGDLLFKANDSNKSHLQRWLQNPKFVRELKRIVRLRRQVHELQMTLMQFWAADQLIVRLKNQEVTTEMLRKAAQSSSKALSDETDAPPVVQPSFVHESVPPAERAVLMQTLQAPQAPS